MLILHIRESHMPAVFPVKINCLSHIHPDSLPHSILRGHLAVDSVCDRTCVNQCHLLYIHCSTNKNILTVMIGDVNSPQAKNSRNITTRAW